LRQQRVGQLVLISTVIELAEEVVCHLALLYHLYIERATERERRC
jgi:hypothetical protein